MKEIREAIKSICEDITSTTEQEENKTRADAILRLAFAEMLFPDEIEEEPEEEEPEEEKATFPRGGTRFTYRGIEFVVLGEEQGGVLAITAKMLEGEFPFDKDNCNDWRKSSLRKYLNEEYIKNFDTKDLLKFRSDLTTDSGQKDYGYSDDYIALLSCDLYRKYRAFVPSYDTWVWTITPWHIYPGSASYERVVNSSGAVDIGGAYSATGAAAACLFNPKIFESTPIGVSEASNED